MKNGAAGKKKSRNSHFPKALPWFNHGSTRRGKNAGKKIESALIWGRHLQKGLVKSVGFFFPSRFLCFFFFFENQFLEKLVFKTSFFNHPNTLVFLGLLTTPGTGICLCNQYKTKSFLQLCIIHMIAPVIFHLYCIWFHHIFSPTLHFSAVLCFDHASLACGTHLHDRRGN